MNHFFNTQISLDTNAKERSHSFVTVYSLWSKQYIAAAVTVNSSTQQVFFLFMFSVPVLVHLMMHPPGF